MNNFFVKNEEGFMAVVSVVLITASFVILFLGMFFYATEESARTLDRERAITAYSLASSCAEIGLEKLKNDFYYTGESVSIEGESCQVSVNNYGFYGKSIKAEGSVFDHERKIEVTVNTKNWPTIEIFNWQDVSDFVLGGTVFFADSFESWTGWQIYQSGDVEQSTDVSVSGIYSLKKINNSDPHGGYKLLDNSIERNFVLEGWTYRPSGYGGGAATRPAISNSSFNGYGFVLNYSNDSIYIERRDGGSGFSISLTANVTLETDTWYKFRFETAEANQLKLTLYNTDENELASVYSDIDENYNSFDRFVVHGGYEYYLDDLIIRPNSEWAEESEPLYSLDFDESGNSGDGDYVDIPGVNFGLQDLTVHAWIKPEVALDQRAPIVRIDRWYFQVFENNRLATYWYGWDTPGYHYSTVDSIPMGEWSHVVVVWERGRGVDFYINNNLDTHIPNNGTGDSTSWVKIGQENSTRKYNGKITDVRIYNRAIQSGEVNTLFQGGNITDGLVGYWPFTEGEGSVVYDQSINNNDGTIYGPVWSPDSPY